MREFVHSTLFPYTWAETALGVIHKYPNPSAPHVVSIDILAQQYDPGSGRLRLERILGVRQAAPAWARKLLGGLADTFVREVTLVDPLAASVEQTSTNMSLAEYLLVREHIVYSPGDPANPRESLPSPFSPLHNSDSDDDAPATNTATTTSVAPAPAPAPRRNTAPIPPFSPWTTFSQLADIEARIGTSSSHSWVPKRMLHNLEHRIEEWSVARFGDNAGKGKLGLSTVLQALWGPADPAQVKAALDAHVPVAPAPSSACLSS